MLFSIAFFSASFFNLFTSFTASINAYGQEAAVMLVNFWISKSMGGADAEQIYLYLRPNNVSGSLILFANSARIKGAQRMY